MVDKGFEEAILGVDWVSWVKGGLGASYLKNSILDSGGRCRY